MEKKAREIFRDALALHYIDGISKTGEEVDMWLKTHGGWFPDPQEVYGDGTPLTQPKDEGWDVMSKEPEKATKEAKGVMSLLAEFLRDGIAEEMGHCDLKASAQKWLDDVVGQAAPPETPKRDRSRSPRRCVIPDMMIATMEQTIQLKDQIIEALQGKIQAQDRELVNNAYRISYLETTVKAKDEMIANVMTQMQSMFKKP